MARLLTNFDFLKQIQSDNLLQIIESNYQFLRDAEQAAQAEMIGYLVQRYETERVFTNTSVYSPSVVYKGNNLVYLDAAAYNVSTTYLTGQLALQAGNVYSSIAGNAPGAFNVNQWNLLGAQNSFFYALYPFPLFVYGNAYVTGNKVWYKDSVYTATANNTNILPTAGGQWSAGVPYSFSGQLPTNATYWLSGDNRNQLIVMYLIDVTLYHLHSRINPRNVPDLRKERYNGNSPTDSGGALAWLKRVASGDVTADLPNIAPQQGVSISWGVSEGYNSDGSYSSSRNILW